MLFCFDSAVYLISNHYPGRLRTVDILEAVWWMKWLIVFALYLFTDKQWRRNTVQFVTNSEYQRLVTHLDNDETFPSANDQVPVTGPAVFRLPDASLHKACHDDTLSMAPPLVPTPTATSAT